MNNNKEMKTIMILVFIQLLGTLLWGDVIPGIPQGVSATNGTYEDKVVITYNEVTDAEHYDIYRAESRYGDKSYVDTEELTTYNDINAEIGLGYYYFVKACKYDDAQHTNFCSDYGGPGSGYRTLPVPTNVYVSEDILEYVLVDFDSIANIAHYNVYQAEEGGYYSYLGSTTNSSYFASTDDTVPGKLYNYKVEACCSLACGDKSLSSSGYRGLTSPYGMNATDGIYVDKVIAYPYLVTGATYYKYYRRKTENDPVVSLGEGSSSFEDTTGESGIKYSYAAEACSSQTCSHNKSPYDDGYKAIPVPVNVVASDGEYLNKVLITFESSQDHFKLYRSKSDDPKKILLDDTITQTHYEDTDIMNGKEYCYYVEACNSFTCSEMSNCEVGHSRALVNPGVLLYLLN